jgi:uncharacterized protein involved in outer membrane biogenesis
LSSPRIRYLAVALAALAAVLAITGLVALKSLPQTARRIVIADLQERFNSTIEIGQIQLDGFIPPRITATGVILRYQGRSDLPPLMIVNRLTASASLLAIWTRKWRVNSLRLEGLQIHIPPLTNDRDKPYLARQPRPKLRLPPIEFNEVSADDALLEILPRQRDQRPRSFWIHHITLRSLKPGAPARFRAQLTNEIPVGNIDSQGTFGPWNADQPGSTPVTAKFEFTNANLSQFRGLSGLLSARGRYSGVLERLDVEGDAFVSDFRLSVGGKPVELRTHYVAVVDGTNGNTYLQSVDAHFLRTTLRVNGEVIGRPDTPLRRIIVNVQTTDARAEDLLTLVTKENPSPISGAVELQAGFELPAGSTDVVNRLSLNGQFDIRRASFENRQTQERIDALSRRGQGKPGSEATSDVTCDIRGDLQVRNAKAQFSMLEFAVPGASVSLKGSYGLQTEGMNFHGSLRLSSKLSQTTTGLKSVWLRALNPFFRDRSGGSVLPIKVTGSRSSPSFGLELRRHDKPA